MNKRISVLATILLVLLLIWLFPVIRDKMQENAWKTNLSPAAIKEVNDGANIVSRVIDGDTLELDNGERVRLIGIDTPESKNNPKLRRDAKRTGQDAATVIKMGKEAAEFTRNLVEGHQVRLEYDVQQKDKYGRTLAYVWYLTEIQKPSKRIDPKTGKPFMHDDYEDAMLNETLIKAGYAQVMTIPPNVKYQDLFVKLETEARESKRGLWR